MAVSVVEMIKRSVALILFMILTLGSFSACAGGGSDYYYTETDDGILLLYYKGDDSEVIIPARIDDKPVTEIGPDCFMRKNVKSVIIPEGIKVIHSYAFRNCSRLENVTVSKTVEHIGIHAFDNTPWYNGLNDRFVIVGAGSLIKYNGMSETIEIPENVTDISCTFKNDAVKVTSITIPEGVKYITGNAFVGTAWRRSLKDEFVIVGDGILIKYVGTGGDITVPEGVKSISGAFYDSGRVTSVKLPSSLERIESYSFACTSGQVFSEDGNVEPDKISVLKSVDIPNSVKYIGSNAFYNCSALETVDLPDFLSIISPLSFAFCDALSSVSVPDSVASITSLSFGQSYSLKEITFGKGLMFIGDGVFFAGALESVVIPEGCKYIAGNAFRQCASLKSAEIPKSVDTVVENAFIGCSDELVIIGKPGSAAKELADTNNYGFKKK